jgi:hypothetical protein
VVAGVLEAAAELVGPKVGHRVVRRLTAEQRGGGDLGAKHRVIPVLDVQPGAEPLAGPREAVADSNDAGKRGPQLPVDGERLTVGVQRGAGKPVHGRPHADADEHEVGVQPAPVVKLCDGFAVLLGDSVDSRVGQQPDTGLDVPAGEGGVDAGVEDARQRRGGHLDDRDRTTVVAGRGGDLRADPAGADDDQVAAALHGIAQDMSICAGVHGAHAVETVRARQGDRRRAGGDRQPAVIDVAAVGEAQAARLEPGSSRPEDELHAELVVVEWVRQVRLGLVEYFLRQRRPLVRQLVLGSDEHEVPVVAGNPQLFAGPRAGKPPADDGDAGRSVA